MSKIPVGILGATGMVFSALEMGKDETRALEEAYAGASYPGVPSLEFGTNAMP
jgi:hypothetical protein